MPLFTLPLKSLFKPPFKPLLIAGLMTSLTSLSSSVSAQQDWDAINEETLRHFRALLQSTHLIPPAANFLLPSTFATYSKPRALR
jgi:hypothetical protein